MVNVYSLRKQTLKHYTVKQDVLLIVFHEFTDFLALFGSVKYTINAQKNWRHVLFKRSEAKK